MSNNSRNHLITTFRCCTGICLVASMVMLIVAVGLAINIAVSNTQAEIAKNKALIQKVCGEYDCHKNELSNKGN